MFKRVGPWGVVQMGKEAGGERIIKDDFTWV